MMQKPLFEDREVPSLVSTVVVTGFDPSGSNFLLQEGLGAGLVKDVLQFLVDGLEEYGISAITLGGGAPIGVALETFTDSLFAAESIASSVAAVKNVASSAGEFAQTLNNIVEAAKNGMGDLEGLYNTVKDAIIKGLKLIGEKGKEKIEEIANNFKDKIDKMLSQFTDAIVEGVKVLIPEAAIGSAVGAGLRTLLSKATENIYSLFQKAVEKAGKYAKFITDPEAAPAFFQEIIEKFTDSIKKLGGAVEEMGWAKALLLGPVGMILKKGGKTALDELAKFIGEKGKTVIDLIKTLTTLIVPALAGVLASFQILLKGEYKEEASDEKKDDKEEKKTGEKEEKKTPKEEKKVAGESFVRRSHKRSKTSSLETIQEAQLRTLIRKVVGKELRRPT